MIDVFQITLVLGLIGQSAAICFQLNNCTCQNPSKVMCRSAQFSTVPNNIVPNLNISWLDLLGNNITTLTNLSFVWSNTSSTERIHHLNLHANNINTIELGAFKPLVHLIYLNLAANNISDFPSALLDSQKHLSILMLSKNPRLQLPSSGYHLPALTKLHLRHCNLKEIPKLFFENMRNLIEVNIADNVIVNLDPNLFVKLAHLQHLSVSNNLLTSLTSVMNVPPSVSIALWGNPWQCGCKLATEFHQYSTTRDVRPLLCGFTSDNNFKVNSTSYLTICGKHSASSGIDNDLIILLIAIVLVMIIACAGVVYIKPVRLCVTKGVNKFYLFLRNIECAHNEDEEEESYERELIATEPHATEMSSL